MAPQFAQVAKVLMVFGCVAALISLYQLIQCRDYSIAIGMAQALGGGFLPYLLGGVGLLSVPLAAGYDFRIQGVDGRRVAELSFATLLGVADRGSEFQD